MPDLSTTDATAIYAAIVATGALALEIRRWFESGPKLTLTVISQAKLYGGEVKDDREYLSVRVTNRGDRPTTITNLTLQQFPNLYRKHRHRASRLAVVIKPEGEWGHSLPHLLEPGAEWMGMAAYDAKLIEWAKTRELYASIHSSHSRWPIHKRVNYED